MALGACLECGQDMSTEAVACPNCGWTGGKPADQAANVIAVILIIVVGLMVFGGVLIWLESSV